MTSVNITRDADYTVSLILSNDVSSTHCKNGGVEVTPGCQISWCCRNTLVCERHPGVSTTHCGVHTTRRGVHTTHRGVDAPALAIKCEGQSAKCLLPDRRPPIRGTELHFDE